MTINPTALGYTLPTGTDYIKDGDNAIANNATVSANLIAALQTITNSNELATGTDFNTLTTPRYYSISQGSTWATLLNLPPITGNQAGWVSVEKTPNGLVKQTVSIYGVDFQEWWRTTASVTAGTYTAWTRKDVGAITNPYSGLANALRVTDFSTRRGGTKYTNGLGAVAIRFDHGLKNMKASVLPLLRTYGLPFSIAINSRNWSLDENAGTTTADVQAWVTNDKAEVWNHGAVHTDATTYAALKDTIVNGLTELRAQIPNAAIDGFIVPGVGGTGYNGFNGGDTPEAFYNTSAGRLILENHAVSTGAYTATGQRVLDGTVRQGQSHYSMEAQTVASIQAQINLAKTNKTGLQLFMHPSLLDTPGYLTTAQLGQVLAFIAAERDAGRLVVLSPYDLMLANSGAATAARLTPLETAKVTIDNTVGRRAFAWDPANNRDQMVYGDTGMRDITALMNPSFAPASYGNVYVRRLGNTIELSIANMKRTGSGTSEAFTMPTGFKPQNSRYNNIQTTTGALASVTIAYNGVVTVSSPSTDPIFNLNLTFSAIEPWPTALPGITAGGPL